MGGDWGDDGHLRSAGQRSNAHAGLAPALPTDHLTELERQQADRIEVLNGTLEFAADNDRKAAEAISRLKQDIRQLTAALAQAQQQIQKQSAQLAEAEAGWAEESRQLQKQAAVVEAVKAYVAWWDEPQERRPSEAWQRRINAVQSALHALDATEPYRQVLHTHQSGAHAAPKDHL